MYPVMFHLGSFPVYSYGVMLALAILVGIFYALRRAPRYQVSSDAVVEVSALCIIGGVVGARLLYVLINWEYYRGNLAHIFLVREGGLTFYGGIAGALLLIIPYVHYKKYSLPAFFDLFSPPIALGYAIARVGCFLNGCCYGRVCPFTSFPLAVKFPYLSGFRYPTQLYSIAYSLVILFILLRLEKNKAFAGELFLDYLWLYGIARFLIEYLRDEPFSVGGIFTLGQTACLLIIISSLTLREVIKRYGKKP